MTITTDAQAEAARELIAAVDKCLTHWPTSSLLTEDAQAALRAYEAQKTLASMQTLTQDEDAFLRYTFMNNGFGWEEHSWVKTRDSLDKKKLLSRNFDTIIVSDLGRAYLAQKPKMRWEVHNAIDTMQSLRGGFISEEEALKYKSFMSLRHPGGHYEVREVR